MNNILAIKQVQIADNYEAISYLMRGLHESEKTMFSKAELWDNIEKTYMRHVIDMQQQYNGACLIAYIDAMPIGFIFGYVEEEDDSRIEVNTGKELYVSDGYVDSAYRRQGIYKALNEELERINIEQGVRKITRFTLVSNTKMQRFLESEGYTATRFLYEKWLSEDGKTVEEVNLPKAKD